MRARPISTRNLDSLPPPGRLSEICKALALLDAICRPASGYTTYTYDVHEPGDLAYMQSHSGDMVAIWFDENGASIRGFELDSALGHPDRAPSADDLFFGLPDSLAPGARGAYAHGGDQLTFVLWSGLDGRWQTGRLTFAADEEDDPDGSETCLWMLADDVVTFYAHAVAHWKLPAEREHALAQLFANEPLTDALIGQLNPGADVEAVLAIAESLGWPHSRDGATS